MSFGFNVCLKLLEIVFSATACPFSLSFRWFRYRECGKANRSAIAAKNISIHIKKSWQALAIFPDEILLYVRIIPAVSKMANVKPARNYDKPITVNQCAITLLFSSLQWR